MMDQSMMNDQSQTFPPAMSHYIPPSMPPPAAAPGPSEQSSMIHYPPTGVHPNESNGVAAANFNPQQQQQQQSMAAFMQMQQQQPWASGAAVGGFASPYMMPFGAGPMMMMGPQGYPERPSSRHSSRPPSRQGANAPVSSSRSLVNGQSGGNQNQMSGSMQNLAGNQPYANYFPPGMSNPWFDAYWQMMYAQYYQNPYMSGYADERLKHMMQVGQREDDRSSQHSAAISQSGQSRHSSSMQTWGSRDSLNDLS